MLSTLFKYGIREATRLDKNIKFNYFYIDDVDDGADIYDMDDLMSSPYITVYLITELNFVEYSTKAAEPYEISTEKLQSYIADTYPAFEIGDHLDFMGGFGLHDLIGRYISDTHNVMWIKTYEDFSGLMDANTRVDEGVRVDEDYPSSFDMNHFKTLTSFAARIRYCEDHLERISSGSGRIVYKIDDERVLKLAKNTKGLAQNEVEIEYSNYTDIDHIVAQVFDSHPDSLWLEMELAEKLTKPKFKSIVGYDFDDYAGVMRAHHDDVNGRGRSRMGRNKEVEAEMWEDDDFGYHMLDFIGTYGIPAGDLARISSYGVVRRGGSERVILVDYGLTSDVYDTHYRR